MDRGERFVRGWEWTWTSAFLVGMAIAFLAMATLVVIPSWWLYFADQTLQWRARWQTAIRDAIVLGWLTIWAVGFVVALYEMQVIRRRLRGERQAERYSGGYR